MAANQLRSPDADLHGMAFRHEGWEVVTDDPHRNRFQARRVAELANEHKLSTHPQRVEIRLMYAVDRAGITYAIQQARGSAEPDRALIFPGSTDALSTGTVVDSLDLMVTTLTGIRLMPRQEPPRW
jgi:hypothetical protein